MVVALYKEDYGLSVKQYNLATKGKVAFYFSKSTESEFTQ